MNRLALLLLASSLAGCPATGTATVTTGPGPSRPMPPPDRPAAPRWDSTGWTLLGSQTVDGRTDRDIIQVGRRARWDKLTLVVEDSELDLLDLTVEFTNGERWSPKLAYHFRENQRSRSIDLPGDDRHIAKIELLYRNTPGGGRAKVDVYGKDVRNTASVPPPPPTRPSEPPPPPPPPAWDSTGWTLLGSQSVEGKRDKDTFTVGKKVGKFNRITLVVKDSDLEMTDFVVVFENGQKFEPKLKHTFREGDRTHSIDLPGNDRYIKQINVKYANLPGGGKAKLEVYGKDVGNNAGTAPGPADDDWKGRGFTLVGSQAVDGKKDRDVYNVGRKAGRMDVLYVVAKGSDLEMIDFVVHFEDGTEWSPKLNHKFKEGAHSKQIDLPGSDRWIKNIEVKYANRPGGGKATVEIWGKDTKQGKDPKKPR